jgi:hypothetical protein
MISDSPPAAEMVERMALETEALLANAASRYRVTPR